jgi:hypothetical protein
LCEAGDHYFYVDGDGTLIFNSRLWNNGAESVFNVYTTPTDSPPASWQMMDGPCTLRWDDKDLFNSVTIPRVETDETLTVATGATGSGRANYTPVLPGSVKIYNAANVNDEVATDDGAAVTGNLIPARGSSVAGTIVYATGVIALTGLIKNAEYLITYERDLNYQDNTSIQLHGLHSYQYNNEMLNHVSRNHAYALAQRKAQLNAFPKWVGTFQLRNIDYSVDIKPGMLITLVDTDHGTSQNFVIMGFSQDIYVGMECTDILLRVEEYRINTVTFPFEDSVLSVNIQATNESASWMLSNNAGAAIAEIGQIITGVAAPNEMGEVSFTIEPEEDQAVPMMIKLYATTGTPPLPTGAALVSDTLSAPAGKSVINAAIDYVLAESIKYALTMLINDTPGTGPAKDHDHTTGNANTAISTPNSTYYTLIFSSTGYTDATPSDIGKVVHNVGSSHYGTLINYDNSAKTWTVCPDFASALFAAGDAITITSGTGAGALTGTTWEKVPITIGKVGYSALTLSATGYVNCVQADIGKTVHDAGSLHLGKLIYYNNTTHVWIVEPVAISPTFAINDVLSITTGTGAGKITAGSKLQGTEGSYVAFTVTPTATGPLDMLQVKLTSSGTGGELKCTVDSKTVAFTPSSGSLYSIDFSGQGINLTAGVPKQFVIKCNGVPSNVNYWTMQCEEIPYYEDDGSRPDYLTYYPQFGGATESSDYVYQMFLTVPNSYSYWGGAGADIPPKAWAFLKFTFPGSVAMSIISMEAYFRIEHDAGSSGKIAYAVVNSGSAPCWLYTEGFNWMVFNFTAGKGNTTDWTVTLSASEFIGSHKFILGSDTTVDGSLDGSMDGIDWTDENKTPCVRNITGRTRFVPVFELDNGNGAALPGTLVKVYGGPTTYSGGNVVKKTMADTWSADTANDLKFHVQGFGV